MTNYIPRDPDNTSIKATEKITMRKDFIQQYEEQLRIFEQKLKKDILTLFKHKGGESTSHDVINFLRVKNKTFDRLYKRHYHQAWYRVRKILIQLKFKKRFGIGKTSKLSFINYTWTQDETKK